MNASGAIRSGGRLAAFTLILPGTWATVPLGEAEQMRRAVSRIVKARVPKDDRLAPMRRQIREELLQSATAAASTGSELYALSMEILPGIPFPASLIAYQDTWTGGGADDAAARLQAAFPEGTPVETAPVPVVRTGGLERRKANEEWTTALDLQYRCAAPGGGLVVILVSVPTCPAEDPVTELFDSIVSSIRWAAPEDGAAS